MRPVLRCLSDRDFRANPAFTLVEHGRLPPDFARTFRGLTQDASHYGLLFPAEVDDAHGVLAVDRDTALLFATLGEPGPLPSYLQAEASPELETRLARLVLDGVLEVEVEDGYVSGWDAREAVFLPSAPRPRPAHALSRLSHEALRRAQVLPAMAPEALSRWLYAFGRIPAGPRWARLLGGKERIDGFLGLDDRHSLRDRFDEMYERLDAGPWRSWRRRASLPDDAGHDSIESRPEPALKVYVSPSPHAMPRAFRAVAETLVECPAPALKMGAALPGLLRPDKLMVYFHDLQALRAFVSVLAPTLEGCSAHGVPFTAPLSEDGLLSWGIDPPGGDRIPGWRGARSWRLWITDRLSRSLVSAARAAPGEGGAWLFALDRLSLEGVDPDDWLPPHAAWGDLGEGT